MKKVNRKPGRPGSRSRSETGGPNAEPSPAVVPTRSAGLGRWTFLTNHSHVLILLSQHPSIVLREVARRVGITERAVQRIIADLEAANFIERERVGRQNHYLVMASQSLRHPIEAHRTIGDLVGIIKTK